MDRYLVKINTTVECININSTSSRTVSKFGGTPFFSQAHNGHTTFFEHLQQILKKKTPCGKLSWEKREAFPEYPAKRLSGHDAHQSGPSVAYILPRRTTRAGRSCAGFGSLTDERLIVAAHARKRVLNRERTAVESRTRNARRYYYSLLGFILCCCSCYGVCFGEISVREK
ncbi:hypothetical protein AVEN_51823-1 [Araneus ventricosus]|uniref:Uncharacterized protein n=1 Tax=Araneus ventricosus TaxID=182803 RepID=A0A4Y2H4A8_ARAVE|nr:hypothetical protein AVEN_51823-1 [Araneus ventricosus]